jgi:hypothetical protein
MSAKRAEEYYDDDDDDDDDDEGDFVPGADDEDEDDLGDEDDDDLDNLEPPPYLQGQLANDERLAGCFTFQSEPEGKFRLSSTGSIPEAWSLQNPVTTKPVEFGGWIQHPGKWYNFHLNITKIDSQSVLNDPLSKTLLDAQEKNQPINGELQLDGKIPAEDVKMPAAGLKSPPKEGLSSSSPSLKKPPPYSLKEPPSAESAQLKKAPPSSSSSEDDLVYRIIGKQVEAEGDSSMEFHGFFRPPTADKTRLFLICSVQVTHAGAAAASAKAPPAAAAKATSKRSSRDNDDDDDDSVTNDGGVEYKELIALHDDARLSTEELRLKYYGGAPGLKPAPRKRAKSTATEADDDDDDDIGF